MAEYWTAKVQNCLTFWLAGAIRQIEVFGNVTMLAHRFQAEQRLDRANQDRFSDACALANRVKAVVVAVNEIDIGAAWRAIHNFVALRFAREAMTGRIIA